MTDADAALIDLLIEWEDRRAAGTPVAPAELCRGYPELLGEFERLVRRVARLDPLLAVHQGGGGPPPNLAGFQILGEVGRGGMGTVYRARDLSLDRAVAIKLPHAGAALARGRFEREARLLARLRDHPHVVPIYSAGLVADVPYFVMAYVPGGSLAGHKAVLARDPERAAAFFEQVARAVEYAHAAGVLHRDLKPSNILVTADGQPRVSDFGVAALLAGAPVADAPAEPAPADEAGQDTPATGTGATAGTPAYSAPEALLGPRGGLTPAADVWSLGVIMYEVLTGRRPFPGSSADEVRASVGAPPPHPRAVRPGVPPGLAAVVMRCLRAAPADRYPTAGAAADALARWLRRRAWARAVVRVGLATAVVLVLAVGGAAVLRPPDPEAVHAAHGRAIAAEVGRGEVVTLVPNAGAPRTHRVRLGEADARVSTAPDGTFTVAAGRLALVELLADPGTDRYRVTADVRENGFLGDATFGVYFGHRAYDHPDGAAHVLGLLRFSDFGPLAVQYLPPAAPPGTAAQSLCGLEHRCLFAPVLTGRDWSSCPGPSRPYPPPDQAVLPGPWRRLVVEVRPEAIRSSFAGMDLGAYPTALARPWAEGLSARRPRLAGHAVTVDPRGGLGVYVAGGEASVRDFRIEPVSP